MDLMLRTIFKDIHLPQDKLINILEIGTGYGDGSTRVLNQIMTETGHKYFINSYEGVQECFDKANKLYLNSATTKIHNEFFIKKIDIIEMVIPNILDDKPPLTKEHYINTYHKYLLQENYAGNIEYIPDIIFIDSVRFSHLGIINKCKQYCNENTIFIMEEDFAFEGSGLGYGGPPQTQIGYEQTIVSRYFNLKNIKYYTSKTSNSWNFITFTL
jgi:hypothetical protein